MGDGHALQKLRNEKPSNLELKGKISKSKTVEVLVNSDIALFSQRKVSNGDLKKDSLGNKYFDFIGASLPIIAGAVRDGEMAREIIENSCGIVVEPENIDGLYAAVKKLILSNEMRKYMSTASGNLALKYTRKDQTAKFISLLEDTLINPRCIKE